MPGRLDQKQDLQKLQELLELVNQGLEAHFNREETMLLTAFEKHGNRELASTLHSLLLEHTDLRNRFILSKKQVTELISGGQSGQIWGASAHDMIAHLSHTRKLLEAHAQNEQELLQKLRSELMK